MFNWEDPDFPRIAEFSKHPPFLENVLGTTNPWLDKNDPRVKARIKELLDKLKVEEAEEKKQKAMEKKRRQQEVEESNRNLPDLMNSPLTPESPSSISTDSPATNYKLRKRVLSGDNPEEKRHTFNKNVAPGPSKKARTRLFASSEGPPKGPNIPSKNDQPKTGKGGILGGRFEKFCAKVHSEPPRKLPKITAKPVVKEPATQPAKNASLLKNPEILPKDCKKPPTDDQPGKGGILGDRFEKFRAKVQSEPPRKQAKTATPVVKESVNQATKSTKEEVPKPFKAPRGRPRKNPDVPPIKKKIQPVQNSTKTATPKSEPPKPPSVTEPKELSPSYKIPKSTADTPPLWPKTPETCVSSPAWTPKATNVTSSVFANNATASSTENSLSSPWPPKTNETSVFANNATANSTENSVSSPWPPKTNETSVFAKNATEAPVHPQAWPPQTNNTLSVFAKNVTVQSADISIQSPSWPPKTIDTSPIFASFKSSTDTASPYSTASPLAVPLEESEPNTPAQNQCEAMEIESCEPVSMQPEETMDWEVNFLRKEIKDSSEPSSLSNVLQMAPSVTVSYQSEVILVLDSNVLISALSFVERIIETQIPGLGYPVIYIPHRVLNELDGLKECKARDVYKHSRKAIAFLNEKLAKRHPRVSAQLLQDYIRSSHDTYLNADDKILLCCMQTKEMGVGKRVILLSNDVNLRNKAIVEDLETFSVTDFEKVIMAMTENVGVDQMNAAMLYYRLKSLLKSLFEQILRVECKIHPSKTKLTLDECIQYFVRRWQPWFSKIVTISAEESLVQLRIVLKKDEEMQMMPLLQHSTVFLSCFAIRAKAYFSSVKKGLSNLDLISSRAKTLLSYSPPEEKDYIGGLLEIFKDCLDALEAELKKMIVGPRKEYNEKFHKLWDILKKIPAALGAILEQPMLMAENCYGISELARILAENSGKADDFYSMPLTKAATKEAGRDMLDKARVMFCRAIDRCNQLLQLNAASSHCL